MRVIIATKLHLLIISSLVLLVSCNHAHEQPIEAEPLAETTEVMSKKVKATGFAADLEQAHAKQRFMDKEAIKFDLVLSFGGKERLNGSLHLLTNSRAGLIEYQDGRKLLYKDGRVYYTKAFTAQQASFAAYTWSYFFLLPYKITDPGTQLLETEHQYLQDKLYNSRKLVFNAETGASPDDWYILYADQSTNLLSAAAYIVTAGQSAEEAEKDPHAIEYLNYKEIDGIPVATDWKFWAWRVDSGFTQQLGEAQLSNIHFDVPDAKAFEPSSDMLELRSF